MISSAATKEAGFLHYILQRCCMGCSSMWSHGRVGQVCGELETGPVAGAGSWTLSRQRGALRVEGGGIGLVDGLR